MMRVLPGMRALVPLGRPRRALGAEVAGVLILDGACPLRVGWLHRRALQRPLTSVSDIEPLSLIVVS